VTCNVEFVFVLVHFTPCTPCNVGLYTSAGGKNELEKKMNIVMDESQKKIIGGKRKHAYIAGE
jgi:hypothetical protein